MGSELQYYSTNYNFPKKAIRIINFQPRNFKFKPQVETSSSTQGNLIKLFYKINRYGKYSRTASAVESRNKIQKQLKYMLQKDLSSNKIKTIISDLYFKSH